MESLYQYGSRAGLWRVPRVFDQRQLPLTIFGVATALARNLGAVAAFRGVDAETGRADLAAAVRVMTELTGGAPLGWYTDFFTYLRDAFDVLYAEGAAGRRPGEILDHVQSHDAVWVARRIDIARHWAMNFPPGA